MRRVLVGLLVASMLVLTVVHGQEADLTRLRAAVAASPNAPSPRCELAYALVLTNAHREAIDVVGPAIATLRARADAAAARSLGACLYNRGRAYEALGDRAHAITDYVDSLDYRPNQTVMARLASLVPNVPAASPRAALASMNDAGPLLAPGTRVVEARSAGGVRFTFFAGGEQVNPEAYAVARLCGELRIKRIDEGAFDNTGVLGVESARPRMFGDLDAIQVQIGGSGYVTCMRMDGVMDGEHSAVAVVFADGCELRAWHHVTYETQESCTGRRNARTRVVFREGTTASIESGSGRRAQVLRTEDVRTEAE